MPTDTQADTQRFNFCPTLIFCFSANTQLAQLVPTWRDWFCPYAQSQPFSKTKEPNKRSDSQTLFKFKAP